MSNEQSVDQASASMLTVREVAERMKTSIGYTRGLIARGKLKAVKFGPRATRISEVELADYVRRCAAGRG